MPSLRLSEIIELHDQINNNVKKSIEWATRIGELLEEQKAKVGQGNWMRWKKENLPFCDATAKNYQMVYRKRAQVKSLTVSDLTELYKALRTRKSTAAKPPQIVLAASEEQTARFFALADKLSTEVFEVGCVAEAVLAAMAFVIEHKELLRD